MRSLGLRVLSVGFAVALAACDSSHLPATPPQSSLLREKAPQETIKPSLGLHYLLYVVNAAGNQVTAYHHRGSEPIFSISQSSPSSMAFGPQSRMFVATKTRPGFVDIYGIKHGERKGTITDAIRRPVALTAGEDNVFVANSSRLGSYVSAYSQFSLKLKRIFDKTRDGIVAMAADHQANIYVASLKYVRVYTPTGRLLRIITKGITCPGSMVFDDADRLYVANYISGAPNCSGKITIYEFGFTRQIGVISRGLAGPVAMTVENTQELWVANKLNNTVTAYSWYHKGPDRVISTGVNAPTGVAITDLGHLFVSSNGSGQGWISVYKAGSQTPYKTITEGINDPVAIALQ